ncbi:uncharacterized protein [Euphorbia lathyris]|uniref:uncharacterized protein isoform X2 n=1 Tax=Euphorbia lathyris TaxID=212925 RepID=UPI003313F54E
MENGQQIFFHKLGMKSNFSWGSADLLLTYEIEGKVQLNAHPIVLNRSNQVRRVIESDGENGQSGNMSSHGSVGHVHESGGSEHIGASEHAGYPQGYNQFEQMMGIYLAQGQPQPRVQARRDAPVFDKNFERLKKMGATEFEGSTDPDIADKWWAKIEDILENTECRLDSMVKYVSNLFTDEALEWWRSIKRTRIRTEITWDIFKKLFTNKYMPMIYKDRKQTEFLTLMQEDMSVAEYELKFNTLAKYAPANVATEEAKCRRFEHGLHPDVRMGIHAHETSFRLLVESALKAEEIVKDREQLFVTKRARFDTEGQSSRPTKRGGFSVSSRGYSQQFRGGSSSIHRGGTRSRGEFGDVLSSAPSVGSNRFSGGRFNSGYRRGARTTSFPACQTCGRVQRGECWGPSLVCGRCGRSHTGECYGSFKKGTCFECGETGHYRNDCPLLVDRGERVQPQSNI